MRAFITFSVLFSCFYATEACAQGERWPSGIQVERLSGALGAASSNLEPRPLNRVGLALIQHFEGWSAQAYDDPAKYCTIGYGHLIALHPCKSISLGAFASPLSIQKGLDLLEDDTSLSRIAVQELVHTPLSAGQFNALASFVFNVGKGKFKKSSLLRLVNLGRMELAGAEFRKWVRAGKDIKPGLVDRRRCETSLWQGKLSLDPDGKFIRARCIVLGAAPPNNETIDVNLGEE